MFLMKNVFLVASIVMVTEKLSFFYFHGTHCKGDKFLYQIIQLINPNYPWKDGVKQIKPTQKKSSQSYILCLIIKVTYPSVRTKNTSRKWFLYVYFRHLSSNSLLDLICFLTYPVFHKSPWWPVWTICGQTLITFQKKPKNQN